MSGTTFTAGIRVFLKPGVLDPQGDAVCGGLKALGFGQAEAVRVGKWIEVRLRAADLAEAEATVEDMCRRLLANPVIEDYAFTVSPGAAAAGSGRSPAGAAGTVESR